MQHDNRQIQGYQGSMFPFDQRDFDIYMQNYITQYMFDQMSQELREMSDVTHYEEDYEEPSGRKGTPDIIDTPIPKDE